LRAMSAGPPSRSSRPSPSTSTSVSSSVSSSGASKLTTGGRPKAPVTAMVGGSSTGASGSSEQPARTRTARRAATNARTRRTSGPHRRDEGGHPLVAARERVLAEHGLLGRVVELEVHPVDGVVAAALLRGGDEVPAELRAGGLRRRGPRRLDLLVRGHARHEAAGSQLLGQAVRGRDVVVGEEEPLDA